MCVSMAPAEFKGAIAFGGEVHTNLHLLGYQNTAQSFAGPNCMLLHVPTAELTQLTAESLIPTTSVPNFMEDMGKKAYPLDPDNAGMRSPAGLIAKGTIVVEYGAYEIVLASSARDIPAALERVSPLKRPALNGELLAWYDEHFPRYSFVLACFNNAVETVNHPILLQYSPANPHSIFVPGLESHNGRPPILGGRDHQRDFKVLFGSKVDGGGSALRVNYRDNLGDLEALLPTHVVGFRDDNIGTNSDYHVSVTDVRSGVSHVQLFRTMPVHSDGARLEA